jgi:molybdenum-dependent DNA-binding transcriptional regulator ModE
VIVECPHCGKPVAVNGFGRPRLNITVNKVYDALQRHHSVTAAARELGCSRGYIYKVMKERGYDVKTSRLPKTRRNGHE